MRNEPTQASQSVGYRTMADRKETPKHRPSWYRSEQYRELVCRRIARDAALGHTVHAGPHMDGRCGRDGASCDDCTRDAVQLLRSWAELSLAPPVIGEESRSYWLRAGGPLAERWKLVARVLVEHATRTLPEPGAWFHCACCGAEGVDDGHHNCAARELARAWHPGHQDTTDGEKRR